MLNARYLASCSDRLVQLYSELETEIIKDMCRRLSKMRYVSDSTLYQAKMLKECNGLRDNIYKYIKKHNGLGEQEIFELFADAVLKSEKADLKSYTDAIKLSDNQAQIMTATIRKTDGIANVKANQKVIEDFAKGQAVKVFQALSSLTMTSASTCQQSFIDACNTAYMQVSSGAFSSDFAYRQAVNKLAVDGVYTIEYTDSGKTRYHTMEGAVRANIVTGINQTTAQITNDLCGMVDTDLVEVSAHMGARPEHEAFQGKVYCLNGERDYVDDNGEIRHAENFYTVCRLGEPAGICGVNCRHSYYPYYEGQPLQYSNGELNEYKESLVTYNDKKITQYDAEQKLRQYERNVRKYKRLAEGQEVAGEDNTKAREKIFYWQDLCRDLCRQTNIKREYTREYIGTNGKQIRGLQPSDW